MKKPVVVIANWNGKGLIGPCLDSVQNQSLPVHIIVVDNGSIDGSQAYIHQRYPKVELIERDKNYGFTGGVIPGMQAAIAKKAVYVALLNNDARVDRDWAKQLVTTLNKNRNCGVVTSKIIGINNGIIDTTGEVYSVFGTPFSRGRGEKDTGQYDKPNQQNIFAATGGASMYRVEMLEEIGIIDNRYFAYYEDVDLSFRARLAGWQVSYQPAALVRHHINATTSKLGDKKLFWFYRNAVYLYFKNMPGWLFWKYLPTLLMGFFGRTVDLVIKRKFTIILQAWRDILLQLPSLLRDRIKTQRLRTISIHEVDKLLLHKPSPQQIKRAPFRWFYGHG